MIESLKAALELGGHSTEVAGLHPILQSNWQEARSYLEKVTNPLGFSHTYDIPEFHIRDAYFAARTNNDEWILLNDYTPVVQYLGPRVDLFEIPSPFAVTIASSTSARVAIAVVQFTDVNTSGYGDWDTAIYWVVDICDDIDAANQFMKNVGRSIATMNTIIRQLDKTRRDFTGGKEKVGLAF